MKKIINNKHDIVNEMLDGLIKTNPNVERIANSNVIKMKNFDNSKVALISGGGSGHEPAHTGYVGKGMLAAAVVGEVFTSPTPDQVELAIRTLNSQKGTLLIVKNYTGDNLNFTLAKELVEADGFQVAMVVVNDDVAVENSTWTTGRRGIAGTIFVHKIAGALADRNASLVEVKNIAEKVINNVRSFGLSLNSIYIPTTGNKSFELDEEMIEFGLGIHGEPGIQKTKIQSSKLMVQKMLNLILQDLDYANSEVALMVNGLGGTPQMELLIAANDACDYLQTKNIKVISSHVGNYMTSLEMQGFSLTLLKLDLELKELLQISNEIKAWN